MYSIGFKSGECDAGCYRSTPHSPGLNLVEHVLFLFGEVVVGLNALLYRARKWELT